MLKRPTLDSDRLSAHILCGLDVGAKSNVGQKLISVICAQLGKDLI